MVSNQKPRELTMFTANAHKNTQGYCQRKKDSICYNLPLHTHDEDHFHHPQILKLACSTRMEWILYRDKKPNELCQKVTKKLLQRQNIYHYIKSRFRPATDLKIGTSVLISNFTTQKGVLKKLQPLRKGPYQISDKPTEVTYKLTVSSKKEIVQHRNNLLPYYSKEYALRDLTQLCSFTGLKIIQDNPEIEQNQNIDKAKNKKNSTKNIAPQRSHTPETKTPQKERQNRKMTEKILPQDIQQKFEQRELSQLRSQPRKNYETFIPQSKILEEI